MTPNEEAIVAKSTARGEGGDAAKPSVVGKAIVAVLTAGLHPLLKWTAEQGFGRTERFLVFLVIVPVYALLVYVILAMAILRSEPVAILPMFFAVVGICVAIGTLYVITLMRKPPPRNRA